MISCGNSRPGYNWQSSDCSNLFSTNTKHGISLECNSFMILQEPAKVKYLIFLLLLYVEISFLLLKYSISRKMKGFSAAEINLVVFHK